MQMWIYGRVSVVAGVFVASVLGSSMILTDYGRWTVVRR